MRVAASKQAIKKAYAALALIYHPDRGGDTRPFQFLSHVFQILHDARTRKLFDRQGLTPFMDGWEEPPTGHTPHTAQTKVAAPKINANFMRNLSNRVGSVSWS